eukprot:9352705-Pyramimonas_sp.AAC.1
MSGSLYSWIHLCSDSIRTVSSAARSPQCCTVLAEHPTTTASSFAAVLLELCPTMVWIPMELFQAPLRSLQGWTQISRDPYKGGCSSCWIPTGLDLAL